MAYLHWLCPYMYIYIHPTLDQHTSELRNDLHQNCMRVYIRCIHCNRKRHDGVPNEQASSCDIVNTAASPARKHASHKREKSNGISNERVYDERHTRRQLKSGVCIDGKGVFDQVQFFKGSILIAVFTHSHSTQ